MESPGTGSVYNLRSSKKRVFQGGSSSLGFKEVKIFETTPSHKVIHASSKQKEKISEISDNMDQNGGLLDEDKPNVLLFKKFDTVEDYSDHHYANTSSFTNVAKQPNWAKRIQEEWKILEDHLPDAIFVRVYESRMDLLEGCDCRGQGHTVPRWSLFLRYSLAGQLSRGATSVIIVGQQVYYHSGGLRLNPNLYENGYVCLSLLNTWSGEGNQLWMNGDSTVLQVLVSIQGLVLNAKPFFNEPGYERLAGTKQGEASSLRYNETAFIDSLKTMVYSMNKPPMHLESLVAEHFAGRARAILSSCRAYLGGAYVCFPVEGVDGPQDDGSEADDGCSESFKARLGGFVPTLVNAFTSIGAKGCEEFLSENCA